MERPEARLLAAAWAVRTLARTETCMPMYPAAAESAAPRRKPMATAMPSSPQIRAKMTTPTTAMARYWRLRKALAPSWMAAAMARMAGLPLSAVSTERLAQTP